MSQNDSTQMLEFADEFDEYLYFATGIYKGGFSKGTANVSQHDVKKLKGLLDYYAKKPHPFTACVRDNRKRFGANTEKYCAVLKDVIEGNTKWRKGGHKNAKGMKMSEEVLKEIFSIEIPDDFYAYLSENDINSIMGNKIEENIDLAAGDLAWNSENSYSDIKSDIEDQLNGPGTDDYTSPRYWVVDVDFVDNKALCCVGGSDYYVVPFTMDKKSKDPVISAESEWTSVEQGWVEENGGLNMSEDNFVAEMFFADEEKTKEEDGLIYKTILREGIWKYSPGAGQKPINKPITVVKTGASDHKTLTVSMEELKKNFESGTVEHVTVPLSHDDKVIENTGFVRKMRFITDDNGKNALQAGIEFTEPEVKEKALRGTIANTSAGIVFDYVNKESGSKSNAVVVHSALTNHPWLTGMKPFGVNASEDMHVLAFSEDNTTVESGGGDEVPNEVETKIEVKEDTFLSELGLSEDRVREILKEHETQREEIRKNRIDAQVKSWEDDKKSPAMVTVAKALLSQADEQSVLKLSEDGKEVSLSTEDVIKRLMDAAPQVLLADDVVNDKSVTDDKPEDDTTVENLSEEGQLIAAALFLEEGLSRTEAAKEAQKRVSAKQTETASK